ncbi:MAG: RagB/SusD family nutrient uptake outer membrane protein [Bacteroidales bacterium]|nr:RagB/SusD family nutrient uptake outer membrane protein [Bacteroidales bacterium]MBN2762587.1 RagB/SusD family nutrient uptake outer membrane protein [Bacteroidales bacterium]
MKKLHINSKIAAIVILGSFIFLSCEKWLEIAPEKDLIKDNFWKKADDANSALAAVYGSLRDVSLENIIWGELRADIITGVPGDYAPVAGSDINPENSVIKWSKYYTTINLANTLLYFSKDVLDNDMSFTQEMKDNIDAEALFLRSLSYFYLVRLWKDVPLVLNPSISDTCDFYPAKSTEAVVIKQIIADLLKAKDMAYTTEFLGNPEFFKGRANKYTIMTLLADVYLWNQQYQKCIEYCDAVINSGLYALQPKDTWFDIYNPCNSSEGIFELQCIDDATTNQINPIYNYSQSLTSTFINLSNGTYAFSFGPKYTALFPDISDKRYCNGKNSTWKYLGVTYDDALRRSDVSERDANVIYYRYADILLMKAEALNELGMVAEAQSYVTKTAERAGLLPIAGITDQMQMRSIILDERAKEFAIEGKRWFDLLRNAKMNGFQNKKQLGDLLVNLADAKSQALLRSKVNDTMMYYLPVPYDELQRNKNLKQNPFYER